MVLLQPQLMSNVSRIVTLNFLSIQARWADLARRPHPWWHWLLEWDICTVTLWPDWPTSHLSARPLDFIILWPWRHIEAITGSQQAHKPANLSQFFLIFPSVPICSWLDCQISLLTSAKESKYTQSKGKKREVGGGGGCREEGACRNNPFCVLFGEYNPRWKGYILFLPLTHLPF